MNNDLQTAIDAMADHLNTLRAFAAKYDTAGMQVCIHDIGERTKPRLTFYTQDRERFVALFGIEGFKRVIGADDWNYFTKIVDGVKIMLYEAERQARPTNSDVAPELLLGREAGIELRDGAVRDVETAA